MKVLFVLVVAICCSLANSSKAEQKPIIVVFDVENRGAEVSSSTLSRLGDYLGTLMTVEGFQVVPRSDLKKRLVQQKAKSHERCYDESCQIEIGRELSAQKTLSTQLIKLGSKCKVTLTLYNLMKATSEAGSAVSGSCIEDGIVESLEKAVKQLMQSRGPSDTVSKGQRFQIDAKRILVFESHDERRPGKDAEVRKVTGLEAKSYNLTLKSGISTPGFGSVHTGSDDDEFDPSLGFLIS